MQAPTVTNREQQDWITFLKDARYMSEDNVKSKIKTPAVLQAFERAKISKLPADVQKAYKAEDKEYDQYSQHTEEMVSKGKIEGMIEGMSKGKIEGKIEVAKNMLKLKTPIEVIIELTGLTKEQIEE